MKRMQAFMLIVVLVSIGGIILTISATILPSIASDMAIIHPEVAYLQYPVLLGMYATMIPFYYAIAKTITIILKLERKEIFSKAIENSLNHIKYCAFVIIALYVAGFTMIANANAMPPIVALLGVVIVALTVVVAAGASFLRTVVANMNIQTQ